jgi:DNA-binding MarR family transcriptional regulator
MGGTTARRARQQTAGSVARRAPGVRRGDVEDRLASGVRRGDGPATPADNDVHAQIGRQFGLFLRRAERLHADLRLDRAGLDLERAAYLLLGRIVADGPARVSTLADDLALDLSTVSRQVAALEAAGLVGRTTEASDRRASVIAATDLGVAVFDRNRTIWLGTLRELLADWTPAERATFARLFGRLNDDIAARLDAAGAPPTRSTVPLTKTKTRIEEPTNQETR